MVSRPRRGTCKQFLFADPACCCRRFRHSGGGVDDEPGIPHENTGRELESHLGPEREKWSRLFIRPPFPGMLGSRPRQLAGALDGWKQPLLSAAAAAGPARGMGDV